MRHSGSRFRCGKRKWPRLAAVLPGGMRIAKNSGMSSTAFSESLSVCATRYGTWNGVINVQLDRSGRMESLFLEQANTVSLPCGMVTPLYEVEDTGRRRETPVLFFADGGLRSLPLQERTWIRTVAGKLPAELLTFYRTGELRRLFPSAGKISGFWTEENEYHEAPACHFQAGQYLLDAKLIGLQFYKSGAVQSFTLWPEERLVLNTPLGTMRVRTGASFYPNGRLKTLEPASPTLVPTPIGMISAYDNNPLGIHADVNSLVFDSHGQVEALKTTTNAIKVFPVNDEPAMHAPQRHASFCEEVDSTVTPLELRFTAGRVQIGSGEGMISYALEGTHFEIVPFKALLQQSCHHS